MMQTVPALSDYSKVLEQHRAAGHLIYNEREDGPLFYVKHKLANGKWTGTPDLLSSDRLAEECRLGLPCGADADPDSVFGTGGFVDMHDKYVDRCNA